jgi:hypothetical protein
MFPTAPTTALWTAPSQKTLHAESVPTAPKNPNPMDQDNPCLRPSGCATHTSRGLCPRSTLILLMLTSQQATARPSSGRHQQARLRRAIVSFPHAHSITATSFGASFDILSPCWYTVEALGSLQGGFWPLDAVLAWMLILPTATTAVPTGNPLISVRQLRILVDDRLGPNPTECVRIP